MGAGKSTVGIRLAAALRWTFIDLDEEIVRAEQTSIADIFEARGEPEFRRIEHHAMANALHRRNVVLALGGGALETPANRQLLAKDSGALLVYLEAPLDTLMARCGGESPEAARRPVFENLPELTGRFERRKPFYEAADWVIQTAGRSPEEIVDLILERWRDPGVQEP